MLSPPLIITFFNASLGIDPIAMVGIVAVSIALQPEKALYSMPVTLLPIVTLVSPVHSKKALPPMLVTLFGMVMLVNPVQP